MKKQSERLSTSGLRFRKYIVAKRVSIQAKFPKVSEPDTKSATTISITEITVD